MATRKRLPVRKRLPQETRFEFSKTKLEAIAPPAEGRLWLYDSHTRGLALMVTPSGAASFYFYRRMDGRPRQVRIGSFPDTSVKQARDRVAEMVRGKNPADTKLQARGGMLFGELFEAYMERHAKIKRRESSWTEYQREYDKRLKKWENRRLDSITSTDVERLHSRVGKEAPYAANRLLALVSAVFSFARKRMKWQGDNPASNIERFAEQSRERWLGPDELPRFVAAVEAEPDTTFRDYFRLLLFTGQRRENVASMRWDELDLKRKVWTIPAEKFKGNRDLEVPLVSRAMTILAERSEAQAEAKKKEKKPIPNDPREAYVFPSKRREGLRPYVYEPKIAFTRVCERAGIGGLRLHDLRRTVSSWAMLQGVPDPVRKRMLGHAMPKANMDNVYAMLGPSAVRDGFEKTVDAMVDAKPEDEPPNLKLVG